MKTEWQRIDELKEALETLVNLYVANRGGSSEFISCITPKGSWDLTERQRVECPIWRAWDTARKVLGEELK